jgi:hypothetical protein
MCRVFRCVIPAIPLTEAKVQDRSPLVIPTIPLTDSKVQDCSTLVIPTEAKRSGGICSAPAL